MAAQGGAGDGGGRPPPPLPPSNPSGASASMTTRSARLQLSDVIGNKMLGDTSSEMTTRDLLDGFEAYRASQELPPRDAVSLVVGVVSERRATVNRVGEQFCADQDVSKLFSGREFDDYGVARILSILAGAFVVFLRGTSRRPEGRPRPQVAKYSQRLQGLCPGRRDNGQHVAEL